MEEKKEVVGSYATMSLRTPGWGDPWFFVEHSFLLGGRDDHSLLSWC